MGTDPSKFIDGVFVPQTSTSALKVTSLGHKLENCPDAYGSYYGKGIINGAIQALDTSLESGALLNGTQYGGNKKPAILMRRNKGVTFDLDAIRNDIPGSSIRMFTALCGISETALDFSPERKMNASFLVLVDGKIRFQVTDVTPRTGGISVKVQLNDKDRFLTLITAFKKTGSMNTSLFADPALELK